MSLSQLVLTSSFYSDCDIVRKYKKHPQFQKQLQKNQKQYLHQLNMSLYSNLEYLEKYSVMELYNVPNQKEEIKFYLNYYAYKMQFQEQEEQKFYLLFIRMMDQKLRQKPKLKFSIIYYHCLSQSTFPFSFLNETFKKLPIFYYAMLDKIYVVQPNFLVKNTVGIFDFGRLHKIFTKRIFYVDNLYELGKLQQIKRSQVLQHLPQILKQQKAMKQQKKSLKQGALQNIQNKGQNKQQFNPIKHQPKSSQKIDYLTINLQNHKLTNQGLPIALVILLQTLKSKPQFLNLQGIFRKSGSIEEQQEIISELQKMTTITTLQKIQQYSGYAIAGVVKKFFTKLITPIIPYQIYNQIMKITSIQQGKQIQFVRSIISQLPALNKKVLIHLLLFLKQYVISKKQTNKMNNYNMSVCFCPCIFRAKQATLQDLMNSGKYAKILDILFSKFQQIFQKQQLKLIIGKQNNNNRGSKGSKGSRGSRNSKENSRKSNDNNGDSPTRILF